MRVRAVCVFTCRHTCVQGRTVEGPAQIVRRAVSYWPPGLHFQCVRVCELVRVRLSPMHAPHIRTARGKASCYRVQVCTRIVLLSRAGLHTVCTRIACRSAHVQAKWAQKQRCHPLCKVLEPAHQQGFRALEGQEPEAQQLEQYSAVSPAAGPRARRARLPLHTSLPRRVVPAPAQARERSHYCRCPQTGPGEQGRAQARGGWRRRAAGRQEAHKTLE